jgi:cell division transport system permease protein
MRLVGASNWFIRTPFLMEGILQSLIGAALAIAIISGTTAWILPRVREAIPFLPLMLTGSDMAQISLVLVVVGILIGLLGSGFAMRRYLKV